MTNAKWLSLVDISRVYGSYDADTRRQIARMGVQDGQARGRALQSRCLAPVGQVRSAGVFCSPRLRRIWPAVSTSRISW